MAVTTKWFLAVVLVLTGCGSDGGGSATDVDGAGTSTVPTTGGAGDPAIEMRCLDSYALSMETTDRACICKVEAGEYPDRPTCYQALSAPESTYQCICAVYAEYPESKGYIDCFVHLSEMHVECIAEAGCDEDRLGACDEAFNYLDCPSAGAAPDEAAATCMLP